MLNVDEGVEGKGTTPADTGIGYSLINLNKLTSALLLVIRLATLAKNEYDAAPDALATSVKSTTMEAFAPAGAYFSKQPNASTWLNCTMNASSEGNVMRAMGGAFTNAPASCKFKVEPVVAPANKSDAVADRVAVCPRQCLFAPAPLEPDTVIAPFLLLIIPLHTRAGLNPAAVALALEKIATSGTSMLARSVSDGSWWLSIM